MKLESEGMRLGRKEVRIRNRGETGDPDGRERVQRCERERKKSREHSNVWKGERMRYTSYERDCKWEREREKCRSPEDEIRKVSDRERGRERTREQG